MAVAVPVRTTLIRSLALLGLIAHDRGDDDAAERLERRAQELVEESGLTDSPGGGQCPSVKAEQSTDAMELLSPREVDVLRLLSAPLTQRDISQALYISKDTVKSHARAIYRKLGVDSRKDAVAAGRKLGLIR